MTAQLDDQAPADRPRRRSARVQDRDAAEAEWIRAQVARAPALRAEQRRVIYPALHRQRTGGGDAA